MMQDWLLPYGTTIAALGAMGGLLLVQLIVLDVAGIRAGHMPGSAVTGGHDDFLFRATRAHANTNESIAAFVLLALFGIFRHAAPGWLNACAVAYVVGRAAHMLCYYADLRLLRSGAFAVAFLALAAMSVVGAVAR